MGSVRSAYITVDPPRSAGCAILCDRGAVGQLIAHGGTRGGKRVLPRVWLDDIAASRDPQAGSAGVVAAYLPGARYCSKSYDDDSDRAAAVRRRHIGTIPFCRRRTAG
jgi:hypothetical protein